MLDGLSGLVTLYPLLGKLIIVVGVWIQREATVLVSVFLIVDDVFGWWDFIFPAVIGILAGDYFVYFLMRYLRNTKIGWKFYNKIKDNKKFQFYSYYVTKNLQKMILLSQFLIGINFVVVGIIGWTRTSFKKFFKAHTLAVFSWFVVALGVAYPAALGLYALQAGDVFKKIELVILGVVVLVVLGEYILRKIWGKKMFLEFKAEKKGSLVSRWFNRG